MVKLEQMGYQVKRALLVNLVFLELQEKRVKVELQVQQALKVREEDLDHLEMVMERVYLQELLALEDLLEREDLVVLLDNLVLQEFQDHLE